MVADWFNSTRHAVRRLRRDPGFTLTALLTLTFTIGANSAIFTLAHTFIFASLPVPRPDRLFELSTIDRKGNKDGLSIPAFQLIKQQSDAFVSLFVWSGGRVENLEMNGIPFAGSVDAVAGDYYDALGIRPALGRFISGKDTGIEHSTPSAVAVIGYRAWRERYDRDPTVVGKSLLLNGKSFTILGVQPEGFSGLIRETSADVTVPITSYVADASQLYDRRNTHFIVIGRLRDSFSSERAKAEVETLWPSIRNATAPGRTRERESFLARRIRMEPAARGFSYLRQRFTRPLYLLSGVVALLLLLACANVASIALARAMGHAGEIKIRIALGSSRWRLVGASLLESVVLSLSGAVLGLGFAFWASRYIAHMMWQGNVPLTLSIAPNISSVAFTIVVAVVASLMFGLIPAWRNGSHYSGSFIQDGNPRIIGNLGFAARALVAVQFALSFAILSGAFLFSRSIENVMHHDPGFNTEHLLIAQLFPRHTYVGFDKAAYFKQLLLFVRQTPGILSASFAHDPLIGLPWKQTIFPADVTATYHLVAPGFFDTLGIKLLRGRDFDLLDDESHPRAVIVSARLAHLISPTREPVGQFVTIGNLKEKFEIIGIANDATLDDPRTPDAPAIYAAAFQHVDSLGWENLIVRTRTNSGYIAGILRQGIEHMGREYTLRIETATEELDRALLPERVLTLLTSFFGLAALILAAIGIYGLLSSTVTRPTREIGVRLALGATRRSVGLLVLGDVAILLAVGLVGGLAIAFAVAGSVNAFLYGLSGYDPSYLCLAAGVLIIVAGCASFVPVIRAVRMEPVIALRHE